MRTKFNTNLYITTGHLTQQSVNTQKYVAQQKYLLYKSYFTPNEHAVE